jgi:hypothetical protein
MSERQIGRWGTTARAVVGTGLLAVAALEGLEVRSVLVGMVVLPAVFIVALALRGRTASPVRLEAPLWHFVNCGTAFVLFSWITVPAMLFYGTSMIVAAWRGIGACEIFAISNWLRGRDDRLGCPLFLPVDALESAPSHR